MRFPASGPAGRVFAAVCVVVVAACASTSTMETSEPATTQPAAAVMSDGGVAEVARTANTGEIEQAQLAVTKATNASVREYAEQMIADHTQANQRLDELLQQQNLTTSQAPLANELRQNAATAMETLRSVEGDAFDRTYIETQISVHEWLLRSLDENLIPAARSDELETYLQTMRGTVAEHLERARQIRTSLGG